MNNEPIAYINVEKRELEWAKPTVWKTSTIAKMDKIPLYVNSIKKLTDEEIQELALSDEFWISEDCTIFDWHNFAKAILRKAQKK